MWFGAGNVCVSDYADPDGRLRGFAKTMKTSGAAKVYWRRLNSKRSLPVLEWTLKARFLHQHQSTGYLRTRGQELNFV